MTKRNYLLASLAAACLALLIWWAIQPWRIARAFPAAGITEVVVRASRASSAVVTPVRGGSAIQVAGTPAGGAVGAPPPTLFECLYPFGCEPRPYQAGLDFASAQHGASLVISPIEVDVGHHVYYLKDLRLRVPEGVKVTLVDRKLPDHREPDLSPP